MLASYLLVLGLSASTWAAEQPALEVKKKCATVPRNFDDFLIRSAQNLNMPVRVAAVVFEHPERGPRLRDLFTGSDWLLGNEGNLLVHALRDKFERERLRTAEDLRAGKLPSPPSARELFREAVKERGLTPPPEVVALFENSLSSVRGGVVYQFEPPSLTKDGLQAFYKKLPKKVLRDLFQETFATMKVPLDQSALLSGVVAVHWKKYEKALEEFKAAATSPLSPADARKLFEEKFRTTKTAREHVWPFLLRELGIPQDNPYTASEVLNDLDSGLCAAAARITEAHQREQRLAREEAERAEAAARAGKEAPRVVGPLPPGGKTKAGDREERIAAHLEKQRKKAEEAHAQREAGVQKLLADAKKEEDLEEAEEEVAEEAKTAPSLEDFFAEYAFDASTEKELLRTLTSLTKAEKKSLVRGLTRVASGESIASMFNFVTKGTGLEVYELRLQGGKSNYRMFFGLLGGRPYLFSLEDVKSNINEQRRAFNDAQKKFDTIKAPKR